MKFYLIINLITINKVLFIDYESKLNCMTYPFNLEGLQYNIIVIGMSNQIPILVVFWSTIYNENGFSKSVSYNNWYILCMFVRLRDLINGTVCVWTTSEVLATINVINRLVHSEI